MNLKVSQLITLIIFLLCILSLSVVILNVKKAERNWSTAINHTKESQILDRKIQQINQDFEIYKSNMDAMLSLLDREELSAKKDMLEDQQIKLLIATQELEILAPKLYADDAKIFIKHLNKLSALTTDIFELQYVFSIEKAQNIYRNEIVGVNNNDSLLQAIKKQIIDLNDKRRESFATKREQVIINLLRDRNITYIAVSILISAYILAGLLLWAGVIKPIGGLTNFLKSKKQNLNEIPYATRKDEIGDFSRAFKQVMQERTLAEEQLKENAQEAERANNAKSHFLANMSHELRTPLNSIIGIIQLMRQKKLSTEQADMFAVVEQSSKNLLAIINDILDLSKIEAGETHLEYIAFDVVDMAEKTVGTLIPIAEKKGLSLEIDSNIDTAFYGLGDPLRLGRILINLVKNAISYTEEGHIKVVLSDEASKYSQRLLKIEVIDTGIGIADNRIENIFEKFTQADTSTTRKYGGTGLGLTITKELVELMDGEIGVESTLGMGSKFWFTIPLETVEEIQASEEAAIEKPAQNKDSHEKPHIKDARILFVEDQKNNILFMEKLFQNYGIKNYTHVEDGSLALQIYNLKQEENEPFDLILMDCHMPKMNGYEATQKIREIESKASNKTYVPIIAMTANVLQKDVEQCFDVGMDAHIGKPFSIQDFESVISKWLNFDDPNTLEPQNGNEQQPAQAIDLSNIVQMAQGDADFIKEMIESFKTQAQEQIATLKDLTDDHHSWVEASHALKGTAASVKAEPLRTIAEKAQKLDGNTSENERTKILRELGAAYKLAAQAIDQIDIKTLLSAV